MIPRAHAGATDGFSLVELLVALAVSLLVTAAVFAMLDPASGAFQTQPESADVGQRLRAASDALVLDLTGAGSGPVFAPGWPASGQPAAAVFPYRIGRRHPDVPGSFDATRLAFWRVDPAAPQAALVTPMPSSSGVAVVAAGPGCTSGGPSCGFRPGMLVGVFSHSGSVDLFSVTSVNGLALSLQHNQADSSRVYPPGSTTIAAVSAGTYFFRNDPTLGYGQLRRYDGDGAADVPVADHVVSLSFAYVGAADAPRLVAGSWPERATYGPLPPPPGVSLTAYPAGENCAFARTAGGSVVPRLAALAPEPVLVSLPAAILTDGPWCPDDRSPIRYDADLLRVRQVEVTVRVESANAALRGPAGLRFLRAGTAMGNRLVPDRELRLVVNLQAGGRR